MNLIPVIFSPPKEHKKKIPWIKGLKFSHTQRKKFAEIKSFLVNYKQDYVVK